MKFSVITVFPEMIEQAMGWGVVGKARDKGLFSLKTINPRDFTHDTHKTIDDRPFGGGDGMVMLYEPLAQSVESVGDFKKMKKIYLSPVGRRLDEKLVEELSEENDFLLLSGRYGGVDQRLLKNYEFENVSVGDYVVSGGELPALILMDALLRKIPGVLGNGDSSIEDSFAKGKYFEAPLFTRPRENAAGVVPEILLNGDHKKIAQWREMIGLALTLKSRPDLLQNSFSKDDQRSLKMYLSNLIDTELELIGLNREFVEKL
jgi:tRNA (guanine37-N1)-methyltransferase